MKEYTKILLAPLMAISIAGCPASQAPRVKGAWKPVNRFAERTEAIPLAPAYVFHATPADGTLKGVLDRWAKDTGRTLQYRHPNDFTLHAPTADVRATDLRQAVDALARIYAGQHLAITLEGQQIVVRETPPVPPRPVADAAQAPAAP